VRDADASGMICNISHLQGSINGDIVPSYRDIQVLQEYRIPRDIHIHISHEEGIPEYSISFWDTGGSRSPFCCIEFMRVSSSKSSIHPKSYSNSISHRF